MTTPIDGIKFTVDTKELESAVGMVGELGKATQKMANDIKSSLAETKNLSKAVLDLNSASVKALSTQEKQAKVREAEAQALEAEAKALIAIQREYDASEKASKKVAEGKKNVAQATEAETESLSASEKMLQKQILAMQILRGETLQVGDSFVKFDSGLTKSQATQLAQMKLIGGTADEMQGLVKQFTDYNRITGLNTFDKSASGIQKINKEIAELRAISELSARGLSLTKDEIVNLVRDGERLVQQLASEKGEYISLNQAIDRLIPSYNSAASELNRLRAESKAMETQAKALAAAETKAASDRAKASEYVAREMHRVEQAVKAAGQGMNITSSNQLVKMEAALRQSGMSAEQASKQLAIYKNNLQALQKAGNDRAVDTISRALGPQITDITVGLATGQSLMTVLLQQGGQLRDQMDLAGVAADQMGTAIRKAAGEMASSVWATGKGVIGGIAGAFVDMGRSAGNALSVSVASVIEFGASLVMTKEQQRAFNMEVAAGNGSLAKFLNLINSKAVASVFAVGIAVATAGLVAFGIALVQSWKENDNLVRSLSLSSAAMGMNASTAYALVDSMSALGVTTRSGIEAIAEMGKTGAFTRDQVATLVPAIVKLNKVAGEDMKETVARFTELGKDPIKALLDLQQKLGTIPPAMIEAAMKARDMGDSMEAMRIASEAAARGAQKSAENIKLYYSPLAQLAMDLKESFGKMWDVIRGTVAGQSAKEMIANTEASIKQMESQLASAKGQSILERAIFGGYDVGVLEMRLKEARGKLQQYRKQNEQDEATALKNQQNAIVASIDANLEAARKAARKRKAEGGTFAEFATFTKADILGPNWEKATREQLEFADSEIQRMWKEIQEKSKGAKITEKQENYFKSLEAQAIKHREKMKGAVEDLSESMTKFNQVAETPAFKNLPPKLQNIIQGIYEAADEQERWNAFLEETTKEFDALTKAQEEWDLKLKENQTAIDTENESLNLRIALMGKSVSEQDALTAAYDRAIKKKQIELEYEKQIQKIRGEKGFSLNTTERDIRIKGLEKQRDTEINQLGKGAGVNTLEKLSGIMSIGSQLDIGTQIATGFNSATEAVGGLAAAFNQIIEQQRLYNEAKKSGLMTEEAEQAYSRGKLSFYGKLAGETKKYFKQHTAGYKALSATEKVFQAVSLALTLKTSAAKIASYWAETAAGIKATMVGEAAKTAAAEAGFFARIGLKVTEIFATFAAMLGPYGIPAAAAVVAALGLTAYGKTSGRGASFTPVNEGKGTVLGDKSKASESLTNAMEILNDISKSTNRYSAQMAASLKNIESNIGGLASMLVRSGDIEKSAVGIKVGNSPGFFGDFFSGKLTTSLTSKLPFGGTVEKFLVALDPVGKLLGSLFGTSTKIKRQGVYGADQSMANILSGGFQAKYYNDVQKKSKALGVTYSTSNKTIFSDASAELEQQFTKILQDTATTVTSAAGILGMATADTVSKISGFVVSIGKINTKGKTGEEIQELLTNVFSANADKLAQAVVPGFEELQKVGEGYYETLVRVATTLEQVNSTFDNMGRALLPISQEGAKAAINLTDLFGGLSEFNSSMQSYLENFYSEEERTAMQTKSLTKLFASMNMQLPDSIKGYRDIVDAQDLMTEEGRKNYATLIQVSSVYSDVVGQAASKTKEFTDSILEYINSLSMSEGTPAGNYAQAQMLFAQQLGLVKAGDENAMSNITGYSDRLLELAKGNVGSSYEYDKLVAQVKAELLGVATGTTASTGLTAVTTEGITGTASVSASNAVVEQTATTQSLLINILDKLTQMQGEDRSEGAETVVAIKSINNILKRAENSNSLNVTVVNP